MSAPISDELCREAIEAFAANGRSIQKAADALRLQRSTFKNRLKTAEVRGIVPRELKAGQSYKLGGSPQDREIVKLRSDVARLQFELKAIHIDHLDDDAAREILGTAAAVPVDPPEWTLRAPAKRKGGHTPEVPVIMFGCWHRGEVVSFAETNGVNEYNSQIMERRLRRTVESIIKLAREHGPGNYPGIVVNLLGDLVSGGLHVELQKTDDEPPMVSALRVRDLLVWALDRFADVFGRVYVACAAGNHGRLTLRPEFKNYAYKNADWLIYQLLIRHFHGDKRITIDVRPSNEVLYRVWNKRFLAMHGDMLGVKGGDGIIGSLGPIMRGEIKVRGSSSSSGMEYDYLLIAHWHQEIWLPRVMVVNALKGWDEYAKNALRAVPSAPTQSMFFLHPLYGITSRWAIYANEGKPFKAGMQDDWLSVFDPGKAVA